MKSIRPLHTALMISTLACMIAGCSLVELDEPGPTEAIAAPVGLPATAADLEFALAGDESREWTALTFQLEGLDGFQFCRLDDTFTFFADGTYRYDGGEVLCGGADDSQVKTGIWELDFDNNQILFDEGTSLEYRATVGGLEENRVQLLGQVDIFGQLLDIEGIYQIASTDD